MTAQAVDLVVHKERVSRAWSERAQWNGIYDEAYRYCVPYRRPVGGSSGGSKGEDRTSHLFDQTGMTSTFRGAGKLQQDLFPPGQSFFRLKPGRIAKLAAKGDESGALVEFERTMDALSEQIMPFFQTGEWDNATSELCLELYIGTGVMLIVEGDEARPVRFVTLPIDEVALEAGAYGDVGALFWKTKMTRRAILKAFPKGAFPVAFMDALEKNANEEIELCQDFIQDETEWMMIVHIADSQTPIMTQAYKAQPFVAARYYRVPGETYGRGPTLMALPSIKTVNRVMEMTLRAAAIQMHGIFTYRPGGTFNPNTVKIAPGAFWPVQSTGGVMGADVSRLDTAAGRVDLGNMILQDLRAQIQAVLHDDSLPSDAGTPRSAAEVMARLQQVKQNYIGAFGRMIHEVIPVVIRRVIEVLYRRGLITHDIKIDRLLIDVEVMSPLALALKAEEHKATVQVMMMVAQLEGPQAVARRFKLDDLLPEMIKDLGVESEYVRAVKELDAYDKQASQQMQAAQLGAALLDKPDKFAALATQASGQEEQPLQ